jgi:hypothetical protein
MAAGIVVAMTSSALAADLSTLKAPALAPVPYLSGAGCSFTAGCNAPYVGGGIAEAGGSFNVISTGVGGLTDNNLNLFGEAGWDYWNPSSNIYFGVNAMAEYGVIQNGALPGGGNSELWGAGAWAKIGYHVYAALSGTTPTTTTNGLSSLLASTVPYVDLGVFCRPWGCGFLSGAGAVGWISANTSLHVDYLHVNYNNALVNANLNQQTEDMVLGGLDYHFKL